MSILGRKEKTIFDEIGTERNLITESEKLKLSGQQDFSCKNFPDKARKSGHRRIRDKCA